MSSKKVRWTELEDNILKNNDNRLISELMIMLPNRTYRAILSRCKRLNVNVNPKNGQWNQDDINYLKKNYGMIDTKLIITYLRRSVNSIRAMCKQLGLSFNPNVKLLNKDVLYTHYIDEYKDSKEIGKIYNIKGNIILRLLKKYNIPIRKSQHYFKTIKHPERPKSNSKNLSKRWKGYQEIYGTIFSGIKKGAISRNLEFDITIEYIWELFLKQNRKCFFTNVELSFGENCSDFVGKTASLDRIDSSKGYVEGNVQWVHKKIQSMKMIMSNEEFIDFCKLVSKNFT